MGRPKSSKFIIQLTGRRMKTALAKNSITLYCNGCVSLTYFSPQWQLLNTVAGLLMDYILLLSFKSNIMILYIFTLVFGISNNIYFRRPFEIEYR